MTQANYVYTGCREMSRAWPMLPPGTHLNEVAQVSAALRSKQHVRNPLSLGNAFKYLKCFYGARTRSKGSSRPHAGHSATASHV